MKYDYVVFSPYFGHLPVNFELWLKSCSYNRKFKFIVFTDDERIFDCPNNVEIIKMSFEDIKRLFQSKFNFKIKLESPYKLCDYKVAFGYVFEEYLNDCKYWGHCDLDLIFGNLEKYLPNEDYDKISHLGPFCLYKNEKKVNEAFMLNGKSKFNYIGIFSSKVHFGFDEIGNYGINCIFENNGLSIYNYQKNAADLNCILEGMNITSGHSGNYTTAEAKRVFEFDNGKIYGYTLIGDSIEKKEYAYLHFQKRKMNVNINKIQDKFIILHHSFENKKNDIDINFIENNQPIKRINLKKRAVIMRIKRYTVIIMKGNKYEEV